MAYLLGVNNVYHYRDLDIYAENGVIHLVSKSPKHKDNPERHVSIDEWKDRMNGIYHLGFGLAGSDDAVYKELYQDTSEALDVMQSVLKDAVQQGDPYDVRVIADAIQEAKITKKYTMKPKKVTS